MVGDYISCSVVNGSGVGLFAIGKTPSGGKAFNEAMNVVTGGTNRARTGPTALTGTPNTTSAMNRN